MLSSHEGELSPAGGARVGSISIAGPAYFRDRVLGPEFFDAADHPDVAFRSEAIRLDEEGMLLVEGGLIVAGVGAPVIAGGTWTDPTESIGGIMRAGLELETVVDRRDFGLDWQMETPSGDEVLGWDVTVEVGLALIAVRSLGGLMTVRGGFTSFRGSLELGASPAVGLTVDADSVDTGNEKRAKAAASSSSIPVAIPTRNRRPRRRCAPDRLGILLRTD
jgi:polyisoprenoid-binding protein YceI